MKQLKKSLIMYFKQHTDYSLKQFINNTKLLKKYN